MEKICPSHSVMILFVITLVFSVPSSAAINNGYERDIYQAEELLKHFKSLLDNKNLSARERRLIKSNIAMLANSISYYEVTENLLSQFRTIAPDLYDEVNAITDKHGRAVNVYIKIIPKNSTTVKAWGITYLSHVRNDAHTYQSEYGVGTVSVKIWMVNEALFVLAHELGHVKYQVPHLSTYIRDYKRFYGTKSDNFFYLGHHPNDPSGKSANEYVKRFRKEYVYFVRTSREKIQSPLVLHGRFRRNFIARV